MGILSWANPVKLVDRVTDKINPVRLVNNTYRSFEEFGDDQLGIGRNPQERKRGLGDPLGSKEQKSRAEEDAMAQRAFEDRRQQDIASAIERINSEFDQFGTDYYSGVSKAYLDYYRPQLNRQLSSARRNVTLASPTSGSSAFARSMGELSRDFMTEESALGDRAQFAANEAKSRIESERSALIEAARGGLGVDEAGQQAALRARMASQPTTYSPLADVFSRALNSAANVSRAQSAGFSPTGSPLLFGSSGSNVRTVG